MLELACMAMKQHLSLTLFSIKELRASLRRPVSKLGKSCVERCFFYVYWINTYSNKLALIINLTLILKHRF